jgi:hypothetical protein
MRRALPLLVLLALAACPPAWAQVSAPNPEFAELWTRFSDNCLSHFPDDKAVANNLQDDGWKPLPEAQLKAFLKEDPGRGWMVTGEHGVFILTLQAQPSHTCIVRKMFRIAPNFQQKLPGLIGDWSQEIEPPVHVTPLPESQTAGQTFYGYELRGPDGRVVDTVGAFLVHIANSDQVELRLARMRGNDKK